MKTTLTDSNDGKSNNWKNLLKSHISDARKHGILVSQMRDNALPRFCSKFIEHWYKLSSHHPINREQAYRKPAVCCRLKKHQVNQNIWNCPWYGLPVNFICMAWSEVLALSAHIFRWTTKHTENHASLPYLNWFSTAKWCRKFPPNTRLSSGV